MNMVLASGPPGGRGPEFVIPSETRRVAADDLLLYSLEIGGPDRPLGGGLAPDHGAASRAQRPRR